MTDIGNLLAALQLDHTRGLEVLSVAILPQRPPAGDLPVVISGPVQPADLAGIHSVLAGVYPAKHLVTALGNGGRVESVELSRLTELTDVAALLVQPITAPGPRRHPLDPLVDVMARLRGPGGCPWDREQTHLTLRKYMIEEAYEAVEAMTAGDMALLQEELGDVLLQVVFHAQLAREQGRFTIDGIIQTITEKLIRRHPHVFGDVAVRGAADVVRNWEAIKAAEKGAADAPDSILAGVAKGMPAMLRAYEVQKKAAQVGFDWPDVSGALAKVTEELQELQSAADHRRQEEELGDLLFAVINVARFYGLDPEVALAGTVAKFMHRFARIEAESRRIGKSIDEMSLEEMNVIWEASKKDD